MAELPFINNSTFADYLHSKVVALLFLSISSRKYAPTLATEVIRYDPPQLGPNFHHVGFFELPTIFLKSKSPGFNGFNFTSESYPCLSFC